MSQCREKLKLLDTTFFCCLPEGHQCAHGYRFLQSDVERFAARAERAEADLAAARALLLRALYDLGCLVEMGDKDAAQTYEAIDAALAGKGKP